MNKFEVDQVSKEMMERMESINISPFYASVKDQCLALYNNATAENAAQTLQQIIALQQRVDARCSLFIQQCSAAGIAGGAAVVVCAHWSKPSEWRSRAMSFGGAVLALSMITFLANGPLAGMQF